MRESKGEPLFEGHWPIVSMTQWDDEYIHAEVQAFITFRAEGVGEFHFGYLQGTIDYEVTERDGRPAAEFSWDGIDETAPVSGYGWAVLDDDELSGAISFHRGDQSGFVARKAMQE